MSNRKRSPVWEFFSSTEEPNVAQCSLCGSCITHTASTTNLLKHLRIRHIEETGAVIGWESADKNTNMSSKGQTADIVETATEPDQTSSYEMAEQRSMGRKPSAVWHFFTKTDDATFVICNLCGSNLSYSSTGNLMKHLRAKHFAESSPVMGWDPVNQNTSITEVAEVEEPESTNQEDDQDHSMFDNIIQNSDNLLTADGRADGIRKSSIAWHCFTTVKGSNIATCKYCALQFSQESGSTSCLIKHFVSRHREEYDAVASKLQTKHTRTASAVLESEDLEMRACDADGEMATSSDVVLYGTPVRRGRRRSLVWECFTRLPDNRYTLCNFCGSHLKSDKGTTTTLMNHFKYQHPTEYQTTVQNFMSKYTKTKTEDYDSDPDYSPTEERSGHRGKHGMPANKRFKREPITSTEAEAEAELAAYVDEAEQDMSFAGGDNAIAQVASYKNRSLVWQCFTKIAGSDYATCTICEAMIKTDRGSTSGLLNHFIKLHNREYKAALCSQYKQHTDTRSSLIRQHFDQLTARDFCCCFCRRTLRQPPGSTSNLRKHLSAQHPDELRNIVLSSGGLTVKRENLDDEDEQDVSSGRPRASMSRKNNSMSTLSKVEQIWRRHCIEREQEHETRMTEMRNRMTTLKKSMSELRKEMSTLEAEMEAAEEKRAQELFREKELDKQFQEKEAERESRRANSETNEEEEQIDGEATEGTNGTVEQTDGPVICDNVLVIGCMDDLTGVTIEIPPNAETVEPSAVETVMMAVESSNWM